MNLLPHSCGPDKYGYGHAVTGDTHSFRIKIRGNVCLQHTLLYRNGCWVTGINVTYNLHSEETIRLISLCFSFHKKLQMSLVLSGGQPAVSE